MIEKENLKLVSAPLRFISFSIDLLVIWLILFIPTVVLSNFFTDTFLGIIRFVITGMFFAVLESFSQTPAKKLFGLKVINVKTKKPINVISSFLRFITISLSTILIAPLFIILFTTKKQGLHDLIFGTVVISIGDKNV